MSTKTVITAIVLFIISVFASAFGGLHWAWPLISSALLGFVLIRALVSYHHTRKVCDPFFSKYGVLEIFYAMQEHHVLPDEAIERAISELKAELREYYNGLTDRDKKIIMQYMPQQEQEADP